MVYQVHQLEDATLVDVMKIINMGGDFSGHDDAGRDGYSELLARGVIDHKGVAYTTKNEISRIPRRNSLTTSPSSSPVSLPQNYSPR